jgi:hypothetical protein
MGEVTEVVGGWIGDYVLQSEGTFYNCVLLLSINISRMGLLLSIHVTFICMFNFMFHMKHLTCIHETTVLGVYRTCSTSSILPQMCSVLKMCYSYPELPLLHLITSTRS